MSLKVLTHLMMKIKSFMNNFVKEVGKYFKHFWNFWLFQSVYGPLWSDL